MKVSRSALLEYSATQMYSIVADVERYPEFLNWCESVEIHHEQGDQVRASMKIAYAGLNIRFTTQNVNTHGESIKLSLVDGPFTNLQGEWVFKSLADNACKTSIEMNFNFDRSVTKAMMGKVFEKLISKQLDAFQIRAGLLYGPKTQNLEAGPNA